MNETGVDKRVGNVTIVVVRSGGFAGLTRTWQVQVDDQPDRERWVELLRELDWDEHPHSPRPDRFVYRIQVSRRRIILPEPQVTGPWRELVERVQHAAD